MCLGMPPRNTFQGRRLLLWEMLSKKMHKLWYLGSVFNHHQYLKDAICRKDIGLSEDTISLGTVSSGIFLLNRIRSGIVPRSDNLANILEHESADCGK